MSRLQNIVSLINLLETKEKNSKFDLQEIISGVNAAVVDIANDLTNIKSHYGKCQMRLCLLQMENILSGVSELLTHSIVVNFTDILGLFINKLGLCLKQVLDILKGDLCQPDDETFLTLMDKIKVLLGSQEPCYNDLQSLVDDLLCHALTIAKLSNTVGYKEIASSCKNVLSAVNSLCEDDSSNPTGDHNKNHFACQLETLERKVNSSMLHLLLEVMVCPLEPLKKIVDVCLSEVKNLRKPDDVDNYIAQLDINCERIHLIGNFAILATDDSKIRVGLQNCLANMEFWEESLVPASINFYMNPESDEKKEIVRFIAREWKRDVSHLQNLLYHVVDPANLSLVAFESLTDIVNELSTSDPETKENLIKCFYQRCKKVLEHISNSPEDLLKKDKVVCESMGLLEEELKKIKSYLTSPENNSSCPTMDTMESVLSIVDRLSQRLNSILTPQDNSCLSESTCEMSQSYSRLNPDSDSSTAVNGKDEKENQLFSVPCTPIVHKKEELTLDKHLSKAIGMSPFTPTLYQKKRKKKEFAVEISTILDSNC